MSRSLVGSSKINTFGDWIIILQRLNLLLSPPESFDNELCCSDGVKRNFSSSWEDVNSFLPIFILKANSSIKSITFLFKLLLSSNYKLVTINKFKLYYSEK